MEVENGTVDASVEADELAHDMQSLDVKAVEEENDQQSQQEQPVTPSPSVSPSQHDDVDSHYKHSYFDEDPQLQQHWAMSHQQKNNYNKRQTGKKNISSFSVGTNDKIEFDQVAEKGFGVVKINRPIGVTSRSNTNEHLNDNESNYSHDSERTHTADGHFDLKFYSHPLW